MQDDEQKRTDKLNEPERKIDNEAYERTLNRFNRIATPAKKQKNITGLSLVFVLVIMAIVGIAGMYSSQKSKEPIILSSIDQVAALDLVAKYPGDPAGVISTNNLIMTALYGGAIKPDEIKIAVDAQRKLLSETLLKLNTEDDQTKTLAMEIEMLNKMQQRIISIDAEPPVFGDNNDECYINVKQYTNTNINNYVKYNLVRENRRWKIKSWEFAKLNG